MFARRSLLSVIVSFAVITTCEAAVDFDLQIRPILSDTCFTCHGPDENAREAELRLDTRAGLAKVVAKGKPAASKLFQRISHADPDERMPPADATRRLSREQIALIKQWIAEGAVWSGHWAYQPRKQITPPRLAEPVSNPIDAFIRHRLKQEKLEHSAPASRRELIRRVTLDLTGLPPTPAEVERFLKDDSPDAYERLIDRVMASPRYGERMAWDWLDASRYADTNGYQGDPTRTMWPWRDWVVRQLNANQPFDRFSLEMLAGDLLRDRTDEEVLATGFNRNHPHNGEGGRIAEETRVENVFDRAETTATVWLGLTLTCCRCHDHKYDPITQREYYRFFAYFNRTSERGSGRGQIPPTMRYLVPEQQQQLATTNDRITRAADAVTKLEQKLKTEDLDKSLQPVVSLPPRRRQPKDLDRLAKATQKKWPAHAKAVRELKSPIDRANQIRKSAITVMVMDEMSKPRETFVLTRGLYNKPEKDKHVQPGVPAFLPALEKKAAANRLSLAQWMFEPDHPLTARVAANRIWQQFFGTGLVKTSEDFGVQGERPSHPQLLDWLANQFVRRGWNVKAMQRLILTSETYRQTSRVTKELLERDPNNRLLARAPRHRWPSWMIRDQALSLAGLLGQTFRGPPVKPYQPANVWAEATFGKIRYRRDGGESLYRRSLYVFWRRIVAPTSFFDPPDRTTCQVRVTRTNSPLHALVTLNDPAFVEAARLFAARALREKKSDADRLSFLLFAATSRKPSAAEKKILLARLAKLKLHFKANPKTADALLAVGEAKVEPPGTREEFAAWAAICSVILNLDEVLSKQ